MLQTFISRRNVSCCKLSSKGREFGWYCSGRFLRSWKAWLPSQWWCFIGRCRRVSLSWWGTRSLPRHASSSLRLQSELHPDGATWIIMPMPEDCTFANMCLGQERGLFLAIMMGNFTWRPIRVTSILYGGMSSSNGMATQFVAILNGHGNVSVTRMHLSSCRRVSKVPESPVSFGLSSLHGALSSAVFRVRFSVHPIWVLQQH